MSSRKFSVVCTQIAALSAALLCLTSCANGKESRSRVHGTIAADSAPAAELANRIAALSPHVDAKEARQIATCAYITSRELADQYHVTGPPLFHNFLVNIRLRKRGLCFQWAHDLFIKLNQLPLRTTELHWGAARAGTWREHNCVVVTAKGAPFASGIVLDAWRHSGRLFWSAVKADHYPWKEDKAERIRLTSKKTAQRARKDARP